MSVPESHQHLRAILYAITGYTAWVGADMFMKLAGNMPEPQYEVIGIAALSGMVTLFVMALLRGKLHLMKPQHIGGLSAVGGLMVLTYLFAVLSFRHLPLTHYYTIVFMSPIVVSVAASKLMQEPLPWPKTVAIVVGFIGVLISMNNGERHDAGNWLGYLFALLAMVTGAITQLVLRFLGGHESRESTSFFPRLGPVVACFLACCIFGFEPMSARTVIYSIMIGFVGSFGWFYIAEAYKQSSASSIAPYQYSQIISGAIVGYLVWNDVPNMAVLIGAALIIGAGIYIALHTHRTNIEPPIAEV